MMAYRRHLAAGSVLLLAMSGGAFAGPVTGSDSVILGTVNTNPTTDLLTSAANGGTIVLSNLFWGSGSGDLANIPFFTPITATSLTLTTAGFGAFTFSSAAGSFVASPSITVGANQYFPRFSGTSGSIANGSETVGLYLVGTFTPTGVIGSLAPDTMDIALTLNENGVSGATLGSLGSFSGSFTVSAPAYVPPAPSLGVREPFSVPLFVTGLMGLAAIRLRPWPRPNRSAARVAKRPHLAG